MKEHRRVLVWGAGVIGCYLAHVLCRAGDQVTLIARGAWKENLESHGLVIRHRLQGKTTQDHPRILDAPEPGAHYDAVFAVMQYQQLWEVLEPLAAVDAPMVVLVGNNMSAAEMESLILARTKTPKTVLFGFQSTAGGREEGVLHCARFGGGNMHIGGLHREAAAEIKEQVAALFSGAKYRLTWTADMDGWYKTHLTLILPIVYVCYATGCDLRRATRRQRRLLLDAAGEACGLLKALAIPVLPAGEEQYYQPGFKRILLSAMFAILAKTALGELAASHHARQAVTELEELDRAFMELRKTAPAYPMPAFDRLRAAMPDWETLHRLYDAGNAVGAFQIQRGAEEP